MHAQKNRRTLERVYNKLYKPVDVWFCLYCGVEANVMDHVPPLSWIGALGSEFFIEKGTPLLLVPSCQECNAILGSFGLFNVNERRAYVASALYERYSSLIKRNGTNALFHSKRLQFAWQGDVPFSLVGKKDERQRKDHWKRVSEAVQLVRTSLSPVKVIDSAAEPENLDELSVEQALSVIDDYKKKKTQHG